MIIISNNNNNITVDARVCECMIDKDYLFTFLLVFFIFTFNLLVVAFHVCV